MNHFTRAAPEKVPYAINRFRNETLRVFGVLEIHLSDKYGTNGGAREYLAGKGKGRYSVADVSLHDPRSLTRSDADITTDQNLAVGQELGAERLHKGRDGALPAPPQVDRPYCRAAGRAEGHRRRLRVEEVSDLPQRIVRNQPTCLQSKDVAAAPFP